MQDKTFYRLLIAVTVLGALSVIALLVYTAVLQQNVSVISYIANGR